MNLKTAHIFRTGVAIAIVLAVFVQANAGFYTGKPSDKKTELSQIQTVIRRMTDMVILIHGVIGIRSTSAIPPS